MDAHRRRPASAVQSTFVPDAPQFHRRTSSPTVVETVPVRADLGRTTASSESRHRVLPHHPHDSSSHTGTAPQTAISAARQYPNRRIRTGTHADTIGFWTIRFRGRTHRIVSSEPKLNRRTRISFAVDAACAMP
jgi:hypothetical protein